MSNQLHSKPNLEQLKLQAKELRKAHKKGDAQVVSWIQKLLPRFAKATGEEVRAAKIQLSDAQLALARGYGFQSWPKLKKYIESIVTDRDAEVFAFLNDAVPEVNVNHRSGTLDRAKEILSKNPTLSQANIFTSAVTGDFNAMVKMLSENPKSAVEKGGPRNWEPLLYLCFSRFLRFEEKRTRDFVRSAQLLLETGANPNCYFMAGDEKETPLYGAAGVANNPELMRILLEAGADVNDPDAHYHVAEFDNPECFRLFFEYGVEEDGQTTMLVRKLDFDQIESVRCLLELGCDPNRVGYWGKAALHQALLRDRKHEFIELLIEHGADVNGKMKDGTSVYQLAVRNGRTEVVELLVKHGATDDATPTDRFLETCRSGDASMVGALLADKPNLVQSLDDEAKTALVDAAKDGKTEVIRLMLAAGFDIGYKGALGATALHWAAWHGQAGTVKLLLEHDAPIDFNDDTYKIAPLGWATHGSSNCKNPKGDYLTVVQALVKAGAVVQEYMIRDAADTLKEILLSHRKKGTSPR